jgi:hypothetical protein
MTIFEHNMAQIELEKIPTSNVSMVVCKMGRIEHATVG